MSEQTSSNVPQIRFSGFSGAWGRKSLGEVCVVGDADHWMPQTTSHGIPYVMTGDFFGINGIDFKNAKLISEADFEKLSRKIKPEHGDILFARYASIGSVRYINTTQRFIASYSCAILKCSKYFDGEYLFFLLQAKRCQDQLKSSTNTGSQGNVGIDSIKLLTAYFPEKGEQEKIAKFLSSTNEMLEGLQRKHDKLVTLKKAMLQKMFPQPGATTPEIRFKRFEGDWVETRLGDGATFLKGKGLPKSSLVPNGAEPCIHYGELFTRYPEIIGEVISRTNSSLDAFRSNANDVLMPTSDVTPRGLAKASCLTVDGVILGGDILVIRSDVKRICGTFLSYVIRREEGQVLQFVTGSTVFHLYGSNMKNFIFSMPSVSEQTAIARYFCTLDALISQHATQLQKLQQIKSACLERMFV